LNFISNFLEWTKLAESPESYFRWAAIAGISAILRDNVFTEWGVKGRLYPNLFVLNVGPPAIGKQLPSRMIIDLVKATGNTRVIAGSASIQAVIKELGVRESGGLRGASCLLYSEELASFYATEKGTNMLLNDLADFHPLWERLLVSWQAKLERVCVTLLAASNETNLKTVFDQIAVNGGLLSKTIINIEDKKRHKDPMIRKVISPPGMEDNLKAVLKCISKLRGEMTWEQDAADEFSSWYEQWDENQDKTGVAGRMKTHIKKVGMCLVVADGTGELRIRKPHIEEAIDLVIPLYRNYRVISMESGKAATAEPAALILRILGESKDYRMKERTMLRRFLGQLNIQILTDVMPTLEKAELVMSITENNEQTYVLMPKAIELYVKKKQKVVKIKEREAL